MTLIVSKHGGYWNSPCQMSKINSPTFEKLIYSFIGEKTALSAAIFVSNDYDEYSTHKLFLLKLLLKNFKLVVRAVNVAFQMANRLSQNM